MALFLLCTIPFWTSNVIRMISWIPLLGRNGVVNSALSGVGIVDQPLEWLLYSDFSVSLGFVHLYTLFMIVPIFNSMVRIDKSLIEAARRCRRHGLADHPESSCRWRSPASSSARSSSSPSSWATSSPSASWAAADRLGRQDHPGPAQLPAVPARRRQRHGAAGRRADDDRGADPRRRHPAGALEHARRPARAAFYVLAALLRGCSCCSSTGRRSTILVLSFQGPQGGLTFPMQRRVDPLVRAAVRRAAASSTSGRRSGARCELGARRHGAHRASSRSPPGSAFRQRFAARGAVLRRGRQPDHALGRGLAGHRLSSGCSTMRSSGGGASASTGSPTASARRRLFTSGLGAHLTWTLPFGLLIMFAVFNRFDTRFEEAARDLGASPWQTVRHVVLPIVAPSLVGVAAVRLHPLLGRARALAGHRRARTPCRSSCRA